MEGMLDMLSLLEADLEKYFMEVEDKASQWKQKNKALQKALDEMQKHWIKSVSPNSSHVLPLSIRREEILSLLNDIDACLNYLSEE